MAMSHNECDHPRTPAARAACRRAQAINAEGGLTAIQAKIMADVPVRTRKVKKAASVNLKRPGTRLRTIGDLPDVPRMLAHGCYIAWKHGWEVVVGESFNDTEKRIVINGTHAEVSLVWRPSLPFGVWGVFVRRPKSPITYRIEEGVDHAMRMAAGEEPLPA